MHANRDITRLGTAYLILILIATTNCITCANFLPQHAFMLLATTEYSTYQPLVPAYSSISFFSRRQHAPNM
jgi:hypothetical protein